MSTNAENVVKIGSVVVEICANFCYLIQKGADVRRASLGLPDQS